MVCGAVAGFESDLPTPVVQEHRRKEAEDGTATRALRCFRFFQRFPSRGGADSGLGVGVQLEKAD